MHRDRDTEIKWTRWFVISYIIQLYYELALIETPSSSLARKILQTVAQLVASHAIIQRPKAVGDSP